MGPKRNGTDPDIHKKILFNYEAHFWVDWRDDNPQVTDETPLHPQKATVLCALLVRSIVGSYFFNNKSCHNVTFKQKLTVLNDFFVPEYADVDIRG